MTRDAHFLARLLLALAAACLLALSLWASEPPVSGSDLVRDRVFLGSPR
jgi:hypothetical protein